MKWFTYDGEVTEFDWLFVFKDRETKAYFVFHNDNDALTRFLNQEDIYCGFNSKHYDLHILRGIAAGFTPYEIKQLNDYIIVNNLQGWDYPPLKDFYFRINNVDVKDDTQMGLSLKAIEGHFGLSVQETTVDFNLDRPWTEAELQEMITYCKHDVDATEYLTEIRKSYLQTKVNIGAMVGISPEKAMSMTNAKLTAAFLQAKRPDKPWKDERQYVIPANLKSEYIPQEVFDFFDRMKDMTIPDDDVFKSHLEIMVGDCPVTIAYGGIHGAIPHYMWKESDHKRIIRNYDVGSYYPHLMTINGYTSRNIPDPKIYSDMLERRMAAKKSGDKVTANALKLIANTTYGATLNKYNDLYDPLNARSVCVSGQLYLLELAEHMLHDIPTLKIVQLNTDGIMVEFDIKDYPTVLGITEEWQERTGFELEEDCIKAIYQKDVNNYVEVAENGSTKAKGGYLVRGIAPAGAFNVNNSATIVADAIKAYFVSGTDPKETIEACDDVKCYQMIAKAGAKYREAWHMVDGEKQPVQKVNRVYATSDPKYGKLYKVKLEDDSEAKIEKLPEHCLIDNTAVDDPNHTSITQIDKSWYIEQAVAGINKFLGIEPEKPKKERKSKMPTAKAKEETPAPTLNVYQKLLLARSRFLEANIKKTGKANKLGFKYFELDDIIPIAMPIFAELQLLTQTSFSEDMAIMNVINCEAPDEVIIFHSPMRNDTGGLIVNEIQKLGSVQTYLRRYLYMVALDIVEADEIEAHSGMKVSQAQETPAPAPAPKPAPTAKAVPATQEERKEITKELAAVPDDNATDEQLSALKAAVKALRALGGQDEICMKIALETKGFTAIKAENCVVLTDKLNQMVKGAATNA